jgi:NitT/TauT family transport system substrate-binding protein
MKKIHALLFAMLLVGCTRSAPERNILRIGHFPNITHAQALVAHHLSRQGKGWFEERLGPGVEVRWFVYNAGPSAMEAIFADSIDMTYVGPSPALNAYAKSGGRDIRIVSGAVNGGSALVVQPDSDIRSGADFRGRKIATPQLGNTQDVACRAWLAAQGLKITQLGGDAQVIPTQNADQLSLFKRKQLDAVWTVEPWVTRLVTEAGGKIFLEEKDAITTVLVSSVKFLKERHELARRVVDAHRELTDWVKQHPEEAQQMARAELAHEMKQEISAQLVAQSWTRTIPTNEISRAAFEQWVSNAQKAGFMRNVPDLGGLVVTP